MALERKKIGILLALTSTFLWGGAFVVARLAVGQISPLTLGASRWLVALIALSIFTLPKLKQEWPIAKAFLPNILLASLTGMAMFAPLSYFAAQTTTAANLGLISVTSPMFVLAILAFKGEKQSKNTWIGCTIALLGSVYLVTGGSLETLTSLKLVKGDLIMLIAALGFAVYSISIRSIPEGLSQSSMLTLLAFFGLVFMFPMLIWEWTTPAFVFNLNAKVIFSIAFTGLGASLVAWWTYNTAIEYAGAALASILYYTLPLFSALLGFLVLKEAISSTQLISAALIIGGIYWSSRK